MDESIKRAFEAWKQAEVLFNNAVTSEEIDYAIYNLEAKRRHYSLLVARKKELTDDFDEE